MGASRRGALFAATYPSRTTALVVLEGCADPPTNYDSSRDPEQISSPDGRHVGDREVPARV